ncbi:hypothetical protein Tco_0532985 [Tanacetum coccineum]
MNQGPRNFNEATNAWKDKPNFNCIENPEQAFVNYASSRNDEVGGKQFGTNQGPRNFNEATNAWKDKPNFNWARVHQCVLTSPQTGSFSTYSSSYQTKLDKTLSDFDSRQERRLSSLRTQFEQQQDDMIRKINNLWKAVSKKLDDTPTPDTTRNFMAHMNLAFTDRIEKEELRSKEGSVKPSEAEWSNHKRTVKAKEEVGEESEKELEEETEEETKEEEEYNPEYFDTFPSVVVFVFDLQVIFDEKKLGSSQKIAATPIVPTSSIQIATAPPAPLPIVPISPVLPRRPAILEVLYVPSSSSPSPCKRRRISPYSSSSSSSGTSQSSSENSSASDTPMLVGPSHKICRSPATSLLAAALVRASLSHVADDRLPPRKRLRGSLVVSLHEETVEDTNEVPTEVAAEPAIPPVHVEPTVRERLDERSEAIGEMYKHLEEMPI